MDNVVKIVFNSVSTGSGLTDFVNRTKEGITNAGKLAQGVSILSQSFGTFGSSVGKALSMFIQGGVLGAAAQGVVLVIEAVKKWREEAKLAAEENSRAFKETISKANEMASAIREAYQKSNDAIDAAAKKKKDDIELTKKQMKAELELSEAKARAEGKTKEADSLANKRLEKEKELNLESASVTVEAAKNKMDAAKKQASGLQGWKNGEFKFDAKEWENRRRLANGRIIRLKNQMDETDVIDTGYTTTTVKKHPELFAKGPNGKNALESEIEGKKNLIVQMKKARQAAENIAHAEKVLVDARKEEKAVIAENQKTIVVAKANNLKAYRDEQIKNIKEENKRLVSVKQKTEQDSTSSYKQQFEAAFDLWRDPEAAAAAVGADKKRSSDLKAFNKAVNRYGGKGKIDEYAALMRAGDEEGMQSRLDQWRKSSKFTPQVEQMVKAEAARQNENASERALQNIEKNTANLDKKIDQLLSIK